MIIDNREQAKFAKELLPLIDDAKDAETLSRLNKIASLVLGWVCQEELPSGEDRENGIIFDISEYSYEMADYAKGNKEAYAWKDTARESLLEAIAELDAEQE